MQRFCKQVHFCFYYNQQMLSSKTSSNEDQSNQDSEELEILREQIKTSNQQLVQLINKTDEFTSHIQTLNAKGVSLVNAEQHNQALVFFEENQRILEYAASCGVAIERSILIDTLHNIACSYQKLWELQKCANYLEAIIYNIKLQLEEEQKISTEDQIPDTINKKMDLSVYFLQFCAVNSQIRRHQTAVESGKDALKLISQVTSILNDLSSSGAISIQNKQFSDKLSALAQTKLSLTENDERVVLRSIQKCLSKHVDIQNQVCDSEKMTRISTFSIGKLMQLYPKQSQLSNEALFSIENFLNNIEERLIDLALYFGVSFFTVGTELRFLSTNNGQMDKTCLNFFLSKVYHLCAIEMVLKNVPIKTVFLGHLLGSFTNHYGTDIENMAQVQELSEGNSQLKSFYSNEEGFDGNNKGNTSGMLNDDELPSESNIMPISKIKQHTNAQSVQDDAAQTDFVSENTINLQEEFVQNQPENKRFKSKSSRKQNKRQRSPELLTSGKGKGTELKSVSKEKKTSQSFRSKQSKDYLMGNKSSKSSSVNSKKSRSNKCIYTSKTRADECISSREKGSKSKSVKGVSGDSKSKNKQKTKGIESQRKEKTKSKPMDEKGKKQQKSVEKSKKIVMKKVTGSRAL